MTANIEPENWRLSLELGNISVPYRTLEGFPRGSFSSSNATVTVAYMIEADKLLDFALGIFPISTFDGETLKLAVPHRLPGIPSLPASSLAWEPFTPGRPTDPLGDDVDAPANTYDDRLKVTVTYGGGGGGNRRNNRDPDGSDPRTYLEVTCHGTGEFIATPGGSMRHAEEEEVDDQGFLNEGVEGELIHDPFTPGLLVVPQIEWTVRWPEIPVNFLNDVLMGNIRARKGHVNLDQMPLLYNAAPGTVLFVSYNISHVSQDWRDGLAAGPNANALLLDPPDLRNIEFHFVQKHIDIGVDNAGRRVVAGWNHAWKPGVGWRRLTRANGRPLYDSVNMNDMFGQAIIRVG